MFSLRSLFQRLAMMLSPQRPPEIQGLPVSVAIPLENFLTLVLAHPDDYIDYRLVCAALCDTTVAPFHEVNVFTLRRQNPTPRTYYVVSDRVTRPRPPNPNVVTPATATSAPEAPAATSAHEPPTPAPPAARPRSFVIASSQSSSPNRFLSGAGMDHIREWRPPSGSTEWWRGAAASSHNGAQRRIFEATFNLPAMTRLTLVDVVIALYAVRSVDPDYQFDNHNCWWFARTSLLLLMHRAQPSSTTVESTFFTAAPLPLPIPYGLNHDVIAQDAATAQETFARLSGQVDERLQTIRDILNSAEGITAARAAQHAAEETAAAAQETAAAAQETTAAAQETTAAAQRRVQELELMLQELGTGA